MFFYSLGHSKVELINAESEPHSIDLRDALKSMESAKLAHDTARLARASRRFFVDPVKSAMQRPALPRRVPTVYRDARTKLLRCVYREIIVRFKVKVPMRRRRAHLSDLGLELVRLGTASPHHFVVRDAGDKRQGDDLIQLANTLAERDDDVLYATPNFLSEYRRNSPPIIPREQWHLDNTGFFPGQTKDQDIRAKQAWEIAQGSPNIIVAVLDDGVDIDHPALKNQIWRNPNAAAPDQFGRDYFLDPADPGFNNPRPKVFNSPFTDALQNDIHGTPCAGLIAAFAPDARAFGVAPGCKILPVKIFHASELASDEKVGQAIRYAAEIADILSCSWDGPETPLTAEAIATAASTGRHGKGCAIFCAVGDEGSGTVGFPASLPAAIAVGASTDGGLPATYSNAGPQVAMVAPSDGGNQGIFTCDISLPNIGFNTGEDRSGGADGLYTNSFGGTSAAVPIAAGAGAVLLSNRPDLKAKQLKNFLQQNADKIVDDVDASGHSDLVGFGKINLFAALKAAQQ
jgi:subtilisin family serine protease